MSKPVSTTNLRVHRQRFYWKIVVWPTLKALRKARGKSKPTWGFCWHYRTPRGKCIGEIHLAKDYCGAGLVAHEMTHAAVSTLRHREWGQINIHCGCSDCIRHEEILATLVERLVKDFYNWAYGIELFKPGPKCKRTPY